MNIKLASLPLAVAAAMTTAAAPAQAPECKSQRYIVTDLGVLGKGNYSTANDMNSIGWVAGQSNLLPNGPQHAFLWYGAGPLVDLGTLGGPNSGAGGPNRYGEAAVESELAKKDPENEDFCAFGTHSECRGAIWRYGKLKALPRLPGGRNANAFGINNLGQIVGFSENGVHDTTCANATPFQARRFEAVEWEPNGEIHELPPLKSKGDTVAFAFGNNDRGQAVGSSGTCATQGLPPGNVNGLHAVLWEKDGTPRYLGTLGDADHAGHNAAGSINERGEVSGTSDFPDGTIHSFIWTREHGMKDLGTLPGAFVTVAPCCRTINDRGEIVGFSIDQNGMTAFVWKEGKIRDLNTLIPESSPLHLLGAYSINDAGEISGQGCVMPACTELHAFRATPKW